MSTILHASHPAAALTSAPLKVSADDLARESAEFWRRGFVVLRGVFDPAEMAVLKHIITDHAGMQAHAARALERSAGPARPSFDTVFVWNDTAGSDAFAKATRSHRIIDRLEAFFDDEIYVYHNKVALKYPGVVGFMHHQDYGYWYEMGNVFPDMATAFIAIDPATQANGCLKLVEGSHRLGRLTHVHRDGWTDTGIESERLEQVLGRLPEVPIELGSGDVVIFHCNVLHASDDNRSPDSRIGLLGCYNTRRNDPYKCTFGHPGFQSQPKLFDPIVAADSDNVPDFNYQWQPPK